jgi:hypothetical protein
MEKLLRHESNLGMKLMAPKLQLLLGWYCGENILDDASGNPHLEDKPECDERNNI